jgi:hypothetical protein
MPRMIDLIRASAVPSNIVQSAAKGALSMPAPEMVEILVYLANHDKVSGQQARQTLAGWDEKSSLAIAADPQAPKDVLDYMASPANVRPGLVPALLANPAISEKAVAELAAAAPREAVDCILKSARAEQSSVILAALNSNPHLSGIQAEQIRSRLSPPTMPEPSARVEPALQTEPSLPDDSPESPARALGAEAASSAVAEDDDVLSEEITAYLTEHAAEIAANEKPFQPIGGIHESVLESAEPEANAAAAAAPAGSLADARRVAPSKKTFLSAQEQRGSALQKISKLDVKGRIQLAMKGNKEERSILVRDGTKVVALGVLESPKITDAEVERIACQKNVLETLLRGIAMKRRFMKNYNVGRNLVSNPRTPLDVSLGLMKNLLIHDLKNISGNKDIPDTIRKLALKMYKQKRDSKN